MTAKSDPGNYGKMLAFTMPQGQTVLGPVQVGSNIQKNTDDLERDHAADQQGSQRARRATCSSSPSGDSIVYVQPFYHASRRTTPNPFPQFQFVVVCSRARRDRSGQTVSGGARAAVRQHADHARARRPPPATPTTPPTTTTRTADHARAGDAALQRRRRRAAPRRPRSLPGAVTQAQDLQPRPPPAPSRRSAALDARPGEPPARRRPPGPLNAQAAALR